MSFAKLLYSTLQTLTWTPPHTPNFLIKLLSLIYSQMKHFHMTRQKFLHFPAEKKQNSSIIYTICSYLRDLCSFTFGQIFSLFRVAYAFCYRFISPSCYVFVGNELSHRKALLSLLGNVHESTKHLITFTWTL